MGRLADVRQALSIIRDNSVVAISGFNMATTPEYLILKAYELYRETGHPSGLFIISDTLPAARGRGLDLVAKMMIESKDFGFIRGLALPFVGLAPNVQRLISENLVEAYTWPIGVAANWFRSIARGVPMLSKVGLGTFLDPRVGDGMYMNELARERSTCRVDVVNIGSDEYLMYTCPKPNYALIRGSYADEFGNLTMIDEAIYGSVLAITQAVKAQPNPGTVIAQVLYVVKYGSISAKDVHVPGPLIDYIVEAPPEYHTQTATIRYDPRVCGRLATGPSCIAGNGALDFEKVIARRALIEMVKVSTELGRPIVVNLGIGIPSKIAEIINEEGLEDVVVTTVEAGPWGGVALGEDDFGSSINPFAILTMPDQFIIYEGGGIDAASLGFMQVDKYGNVNPSFLPGRVTGPGGFPSIAYGAQRVYFAGGFTAGRRIIEVKDGELKIVKDGDVVKFVNKAYKIAFNADLALKMGKEVLYITERAVFRLTPGGLVLEEYAPGVDVEKDILGKMEFKPAVSRNLREMDRELFIDKPLGLKKEVLKALRS